MMMENQIAKKLMTLPSYPSQDEINDAFQDLVQVPFTLDQNGKLQRISDIDKMTNGQAIWSKTQIMTLADYFYDDFVQQQIKAAVLNIDKIENYYTEERRIAYNSTKPKFELDEKITEYSTFCFVSFVQISCSYIASIVTT